MRWHEGELEFRRDSVILCAIFLVVSLLCTKIVLNRINTIAAQQDVMRVEQTSVIRKIADSQLRDLEIMERLQKLEASERAAHTLQQENVATIRKIQKILKER